MTATEFGFIGVYAQPLGDDFPASVVRGLKDRLSGHPPSDMAKVTLIVNTTRMLRRVTHLFQNGPPGFLPRILTLSQIEQLCPQVRFPDPRSSLQRRLQLAGLLRPILLKHPELAAQSSLFALTDG